MARDEAVGHVQRQKMEALGHFAGGIAHDFNNILSIIEGHTHIAIRQLREGTLTSEQLQKVLKSTQRGAGLTRQLLSFGRQKINLEQKTNVVDALRQQHTLLHPLLGDSIQLFMTVPEDPVWVNASSDQLTQIFLNLSLNARDAMPEGGEIAIICMPCRKPHVPEVLRHKYPGTSFLRISIVDSGEGIHPELLPRIFDPFFTTKDQGKGTGLGLSVVYGIVDQMKGTIEVSSVPGEGTSFDIYLPIVTPPPQSIMTPEQTRHGALDGKTILVAEDESELREVLMDLFNSMNMNVLTAENGNRALVVQDEHEGPIDFLLTDVVMPEMDGVKLGEMFQSVRPDSDIVYMSGYPFMDGRRNIQVPDNASFISKPLQKEAVRDILERALQHRQERLREQDR